MAEMVKRIAIWRGVLWVCFGLVSALLTSCGSREPEQVHVGFIGPLSGNAEDLGAGPAKAIELAVVEYNQRRTAGQPEVVLHVRDDQWDGDRVKSIYEELRREFGIRLLLMSNTEGTIALQEEVERDGVILVNSLNNDALLASLNANTFSVGKKTEEAAEMVAGRVVELGKRNVRGFHVTNSFMTIYADAFQAELKLYGFESEILPVDIDKVDYRAELERFREEGCEALVFFGYKNLGFAMKQARELGMDAVFLGSTTMLGEGFFENSGGAIVGTEFSYFAEGDGNYVLARQFLDRYAKHYGAGPFSIWPAMQAYDAMNIVLSVLGRVGELPSGKPLDRWMARELHQVRYFQGVCGNLAILDDGTSRGIYFSLYEIKGRGVVEKVRR